ncbi:NEDD8-conjugating protein ubc12 [Coemansia erecta]|uniref:NEDD8-conjugating enzyme UBC12 n=1 Tax=Coemansia asiatica TaxID=1052880 RepID=A0A9W7XQA1_9FUNG|nr:NEDD8-conjugating protein ubc12 [Coemansia asiatica]KAJ2853613.1 NEDD8-conjugating protein ubc12 [Coemansia asiatica]KAJ2857990.1 NEDD8-conjugating protein ubc12 [Coemansia erecta]
MLKIWKQKKTEAEAQRLKPKGLPSRIRLQKDISEIIPSKDTDIKFPNTSDQTRFNMVYRPPTGYYEGGEFRFSFEISENYPHEAPKVLCTQTIFHPNIDTEGHVCLNVLREDWKPVLNIQSVIFGLQMLFLEPNPEDPLNKEAASTMIEDRNRFARTVRETMTGYTCNGVSYDNVMDPKNPKAKNISHYY